MKNREFLKTIFKKRKNRIIAVTICFALGSAVFAVSLRINSVRAQEASASVIQSAAVTKGSISNTIDASGNLETSETIDITIPTGVKVEKLKVETGEEVTKGQTLATLNKTSVTRLLINVKDNLDAIDDELDQSLSSLEEEELEGEKAELEEMEKKLLSLYKKPSVKAPSDGIIGTINISENADTGDTTDTVSSDNTAQTASISQMSAKDTPEDTPKLLFLTADTSTQTDQSELSGNTEQSDDTDSSEQGGGSDESSAPKTVTDFSSLSIKTPVTGETPQKSIQETDMYKGTISWDCSNSTFQSQTVYTATIVLTAKSGYTFSEKNLPIIKDASFHWSIYHSGEGNTLKIVAKYEKTSAAQSDSSGAGSGTDTSGSDAESSANPGAKDSDNTKSNTAGTDNPAGNSASKDAGKSGNSSGSIAGSGGGKSGFTAGSGSGTGSSGSASSSGSTSKTASENANTYETVALTLASQDEAKITVNVDELDILSVEKNQDASITLDALEDETFTGTVTKVGNTASAGNGSTKYEVEITVPMDDRMRIGMSASVAIQVSKAENTLILPMAALQQRGEETFVYTSKDKDGTLSGEVTVETGLSDGQNVEISGDISEGTKVYYTRTSRDENSRDKEMGFPGIMNGNGAPGTPPNSERRKTNSDNNRGGGTFPGGKPSGN